MRLPKLNIRSNPSFQQTEFRGINYTDAANNGAVYNTQNMASNDYPLLSARGKRLSVYSLSSGNGIYYAGKLFYSDGTTLYADGVSIGSVSEGEKVFCALGERLLVFPDKKIYTKLPHLSTEETAWTLEALGAAWSGNSLTFTNGSYAGEDADANTIEATGVTWSTYFREGDAVTISGCTQHTENNKTAIIREIDGNKLHFYPNSLTLDGEDGDTPYTETGSMKIERVIPDLDHLCVCDNRVWGCKGDTIWCCALGDPYNWYSFDGVGTDAWSVESGTAGDFTACIAFLGYPVFFKADGVFKVYGDLPSNYQLIASAKNGVPKQNSKSLAIAGDVLFYLGDNAVYAYSGGVPQSISDAFGAVRLYAGIGGTDGRKYYLSALDSAGASHLYVYDTQNGQWYREDGLRAVGFAFAPGTGLYAATQTSIMLIGNPISTPAGATAEASFTSYAEFSDYDYMSFDGKRPIRMKLRAEVEALKTLTLAIQYDNSGVWETVGIVHATKKAPYTLQCPIRRCDHYRIKLTGTGAWTLYALEHEFYSGGRK